MSTTEKILLGTQATLMSTELNSLASSSDLSAGAIASAAYDNTQAAAGDGYISGDLELVLAAPAGALTANTAAYIWFLKRPDGTNYEDGGSATIPARPPNAIIPVRAVSTAQRIVIEDVDAPSGPFKALLSQDTGQTWGASGNTLKWTPRTRQGV